MLNNDSLKALAARNANNETFTCNDCGSEKPDSENHPNLHDICFDCHAERAAKQEAGRLARIAARKAN